MEEVDPLTYTTVFLLFFIFSRSFSKLIAAKVFTSVVINIEIPVCVFQTSYNYGTGAGHGAPGGSETESEPGGIVYDTTQNPVEAGSGGGSDGTAEGGSGGGYLKMRLYIGLTNNGTEHFFHILFNLSQTSPGFCVSAVQVF